MNAPNSDAFQDMALADRFRVFLETFTAPLLPPERMTEVLTIFRGLTEECLADYGSVDHWNSGLATDGVPIELSMVVGSEGRIDVRFLVDTQLGPQQPEDSRPLLRRRAELVIPESPGRGEIIDRLLAQHLDDSPDLSASYTGLGMRVSAHGPRAGRLYFRNWWRTPESSREILSRWMRREDADRLWSSPLGRGPIAGVGYDFSPNGLGRVKLYAWTGESPRADCSALAAQFLGDRAQGLEDLLNTISAVKHPFWVLPTTLVAVGVRPEGGFHDLAFYMPAGFWEWRAFRDMRPAFAAAVNRMGVPFSGAGAGGSGGAPGPWGFTPTWLALTGSLRELSVSVYFKPVRDLGRTPLAGWPSDVTISPALRETAGDKAECGKALDSMYQTLIGTEPQ